MQLLVSVSNAAEASDALAGGADIIDAKNPRVGALGAVTETVLRQIHAAVAGSRLVTAALGDAADACEVRQQARAFGAAGARYVKVGLAGVADAERAVALATAAVQGAAAAQSSAILVTYADVDPARSLSPTALVDVAARAGARGVLLDTAEKRGPGLRALVAPRALAAWVAHAHALRLLVALAGKLTAADLPHVRDAGADIAGVRSAACRGSRTSRVDEDKVRHLRAICHEMFPNDADDQTGIVTGVRTLS